MTEVFLYSVFMTALTLICSSASYSWLPVLGYANYETDYRPLFYAPSVRVNYPRNVFPNDQKNPDDIYLQETPRYNNLQKPATHTPNTLATRLTPPLKTNDPKTRQNPFVNVASKFSCNPFEKYRSFDGSCNNLQRPEWGTPNTPIVRLLSPVYADGISEMRMAQDGKPLPSPRVIRTTLFPDDNTADPKWTHALMSWGQIVAHDIAFRSVQEAPRNCCNADGSCTEDDLCAAIPIPANDYYYSKFNLKCSDLKRASTIDNSSCTLSPARQFSNVTHYLDGSLIYGLNKNASDSLRLFRNGLFKTRETEDGRSFLLNNKNSEGICDLSSDSELCYLSGDPIRVNFNPEVSVTQTMFLRLHNIVATDLQRMHESWSDETIFQEARRIVIAFLQHITYNEYLPNILGLKCMQENNLSPQESGYAKGYNPDVNPTGISEFTAAAFRSFHNSIPGHYSLVNENRTVLKSIELSEHFNKPNGIEESGNFDALLRGLISQPQKIADATFTEEITNFLFRPKCPAKGPGDDLISIDIMRGRDYGIPPYTTTRRLCGFPCVNDFEDLKDVMEEDIIRKLRKVYSNVHDIDYFVGALLENRLPGTMTTPSFHCVMTEAFFRYKFGDRYFYEFDEYPGAFSPAQLDSIRKFTYSTLVCLIGDNVKYAQRHGFLLINSTSNPLEFCSDIIKENYNLDAWM